MAQPAIATSQTSANTVSASLTTHSTSTHSRARRLRRTLVIRGTTCSKDATTTEHLPCRTVLHRGALVRLSIISVHHVTHIPCASAVRQRNQSPSTAQLYLTVSTHVPDGQWIGVDNGHGGSVGQSTMLLRHDRSGHLNHPHQLSFFSTTTATNRHGHVDRLTGFGSHRILSKPKDTGLPMPHKLCPLPCLFRSLRTDPDSGGLWSTPQA